MARWRLQLPHYLMTDPPSEVEFKETDRETGRQARKVYQVPTYLDPKDPADWKGELGVVSNGNNPGMRDIIFVGDPTADMEPIDDEAKQITQSFIDSGKWKRPEEGLDYGESLIKTFMDKMDKMVLQPQAVAVPSIDPKAFSDLQAQVTALIEQNAKLQSQLLSQRRV